MPKKKTGQKQTKKKTAETKQNLAVVTDNLSMVFHDTAVDVSGDARQLQEKIMREIERKIRSLGLSDDELANIDLARLFHSMSTPKATGPKERAEDLVFTAHETDDPKKKIEIAKKALKIDADNVEALVILAEYKSRHVFDAIAGYRQAVAAGERSFGEEFMRNNAGHFWAIYETRPYMLALEELAGILRSVMMEQGGLPRNNEEAVDIYRKLLRLNPDDDQGIRYKLLYFLLELNRDDEAEELYGQYSDDLSAWWIYGRALLDFRKSGDTATSRKSLQKAIAYNKYFPLYLLRRKPFPAAPPGNYGVGDANEAAYYMNASFDVWMKSSGAVQWIEKYFDKR